MIQYLYVFIRRQKDSMKVGVTTNVRERFKKIESDFGEIDKNESRVYRCENRKLIEKIEGGIHAFLFHYYQSPKVIGGGSTEWFSIDSLEKCLNLLDMYCRELSDFCFVSSLREYLGQGQDFEDIMDGLKISMSFMEAHSQMAKLVTDYIHEKIDECEIDYSDNYNILRFKNPIELTVSLPKYNWVDVHGYELRFNIEEYNKWKHSGESKEVREVVYLRFFDNYAFKNIKSILPKN